MRTLRRNPPVKSAVGNVVEIKIRIAPELKAQLEAKAKARGWSIGAVARALFRLWIQEDLVGPDDIGEEQTRSQKRPRKRRDASNEGK